MQDNQKIAVFIDFENISLSAANHFGEFDLGLLLKAIRRLGRITLKRAYGDWSRLIKYRDALRTAHRVRRLVRLRRARARQASPCGLHRMDQDGEHERKLREDRRGPSSPRR